jgi:hypothetical protein
VTDAAVVVLGNEQGFFEDEGLEVEFGNPAAGGSSIVAAVIAGEYHVGYSATLSIFQAIEGGNDLTLISPASGTFADPEKGTNDIITDPALVASSIAQTLSVRERGDQPILEGLQSALREQEKLILLDNFEHLLDAVNDLATLLDSCPKLKLLVTSRIPLRLRAEHVRSVTPLPVPNQRGGEAPHSLLKNDSVALFVDRANAGSPHFELTTSNASAVASICTRLDSLKNILAQANDSTISWAGYV